MDRHVSAKLRACSSSALRGSPRILGLEDPAVLVGSTGSLFVREFRDTGHTGQSSRVIGPIVISGAYHCTLNGISPCSRYRAKTTPCIPTLSRYLEISMNPRSESRQARRPFLLCLSLASCPHGWRISAGYFESVNGARQPSNRRSFSPLRARSRRRFTGQARRTRTVTRRLSAY